MGQIIIPHAVKREPNKLYYVDGEGNIGEAELQRGGKHKKKHGKSRNALFPSNNEQQR